MTDPSEKNLPEAKPGLSDFQYITKVAQVCSEETRELRRRLALLEAQVGKFQAIFDRIVNEEIQLRLIKNENEKLKCGYAVSPLDQLSNELGKRGR